MDLVVVVVSQRLRTSVTQDLGRSCCGRYLPVEKAEDKVGKS